MFHQHSNINSSKSITVKTKYTLDKCKEIVYLAKAYFMAISKGKPMPTEKLPPLDELLEANRIVRAYIENSNQGIGFKLYNASLSVEQTVAVWFFANEPDVNVTLGKFQMFIIKHS